MAMRVVIATLIKDLRLFFSDRRAVIMSFVTPIAIASFFGFLFSGSGSSEVARIPVLVADRDGSTISQALVKGLQGEKALQVGLSDEGPAREKVRKGKATVAVLIPPGFGDSSARAFFNASTKPVLTFLYDPSHAAELGMVRGILTEHVMQSVSKEAFTGRAGRETVRETLDGFDTNPSLSSMPEADKAALKKLLTGVKGWQDQMLKPRESAAEEPTQGPTQGFTMPYATNEEAVTSGKDIEYNGYAHSFGGMAIQFILFAAIELGMGILEERDQSLWKRLRTAPVSRWSLLGGKAASGALIALLILFVTMGFGMVVFGIRIHGSVVGFAGICVASALMASTLGLFIAAVGQTAGATRGIAIGAILILVMLGGAWVPAFIFPAWLQKVTLIIPIRWAVDGLDAVTWRGIGLSGAVTPVLVLLLFAALFALLAVWRFRWEEG